MTALSTIARLTRRLFGLPSRLLIRHIDGQRAQNRLPPMGWFLRGCMHGFVWLIALMVFSMATHSAPPEPVPVTRPTPPRYVPPPIPTGVLEPIASEAPEPEPAPAPVPEPDVDVHVDTDHHDLPDGALTGGYCRRKWWC